MNKNTPTQPDKATPRPLTFRVHHFGECLSGVGPQWLTNAKTFDTKIAALRVAGTVNGVVTLDIDVNEHAALCAVADAVLNMPNVEKYLDSIGADGNAIELREALAQLAAIRNQTQPE